MAVKVSFLVGESFEQLQQKIEDRSATIGVIGLGYVGLPVAVSFAEAGFPVIGVDLSEEKVASLHGRRSYLTDVSDERVAAINDSGRFAATTSFAALHDVDAVLICVPTPITQGQPDLSNVVSAARSLAKVLRSYTLVVLESTTYPGSTEELLQPILENDGLAVGSDLALAFSPERIDPGNSIYSFTDIPKIVGGVDDFSTRIAAVLYSQVVPKVVTVSSTREAELAKLIENTFRHVNIALVNELAIYAHEMDIDIWEAIDAAASKPFGFMPFWPGPGWGGHCIPLDPAYLSWRVRRDRAHEIHFVETAQAVNSEMPRFVAERISLLLNDQGKSVRNAKILGIGVSYKPGVDDTREAGALKVLTRLASRGAQVTYHDPLVDAVAIGELAHRSMPLSPQVLAEQDLVVILVAQANVDWEMVAKEAPFVLDCCNALGMKSQRIRRL